MRSYLFLVIALIFVQEFNAQNIVDALRYSTEGLFGTARYNSMGGAFGALGGDLSGMQQNPAGSAVFLSSSASVSLSFFDKKNETNYFNSLNTTYNSDLSFNQAGAVFVFDNFNEDSTWRKFTLGFNYEMTNNFDNAHYSSGQSSNSIDSYFLGYADGIPLNLLELQQGETISSLYRFLGENEGFAAQQAFLGYQSYILDPVDFDNPNNTSYTSNVASGIFNQEYLLESTGYNAKFTVNLGAQLHDNFYLGLNLNSHVIDYRESNYFYETNTNSGSLVNTIAFRNNLAVIGDGFSAQVGVISKATDFFRFGFVYDTPTWYSIAEETTQQISTIRDEEGQPITEQIRPNIINVYEEYTLKTPGKFTGSVAYLFGRDGLISVDYSYKDYSSIQFRPTENVVFTQENNKIENVLKGSSAIKIGGEYRYNVMSFRAGFRYEESPYKDTSLMDDLTGFSLGAGYNFGSFKVDLSYSHAEQDRLQQLYPNSNFRNANMIASTDSLFTLTTNFTF